MYPSWPLRGFLFGARSRLENPSSRLDNDAEEADGEGRDTSSDEEIVQSRSRSKVKISGFGQRTVKKDLGRKAGQKRRRIPLQSPHRLAGRGRGGMKCFLILLASCLSNLASHLIYLIADPSWQHSLWHSRPVPAKLVQQAMSDPLELQLITADVSTEGANQKITVLGIF
jgi:hypothetical protein